MRCRVLNCASYSKNKSIKCSFFAFPADDAVAKVWVDFCQQKKPFNLNTSAICEKHFTDNDVENLMQFNMGFAKNPMLKRGAVPTIFECSVSDEASHTQDEVSVDELITHPNFEGVLLDCNKENRTKDGYADASVSPNHSYHYYDSSLHEVEVLETEIKTLKREKAILLKRNKKQRKELASLRRRSNQKRLKYKLLISSLKTRLNSMTGEVKNIEEILGC